MEWQQVIGFYHVAKLGSFTRAAEATFRTQSALTQQIKALEREFDCELLERIGKRRVLLTSAGERFFRFAGALLRDFDQLHEDIAEHRGLKKGRLRIAAPFTTLYHLLPGPAGTYVRRFPWVELTLLDRPQREVVELVREGEADLGLVQEGIVPGELRRRRWKKVEPVLLLPKGHPLARRAEPSIEEIAGCPLIMPPRTSGSLHRNRLEALFAKHDLQYHVVMESSNIELSARYVEMGLGVSFASIVPGLPVLRQRKLSYRSLGRYFAPEHLCVITRKEKRMSSCQEAFLDLLFGP